MRLRLHTLQQLLQGPLLLLLLLDLLTGACRICQAGSSRGVRRRSSVCWQQQCISTIQKLPQARRVLPGGQAQLQVHRAQFKRVRQLGEQLLLLLVGRALLLL
jgi:hypothetical protein